MRKSFLLIVLAMFVTQLRAQSVMEYNEIPTNAYYSADGQKSGVLVECDTIMPNLTFYSNLLGNMIPKQTMTRGSSRFYRVEFDLSTGDLKQNLQIYATGYNTISVPIHFTDAHQTRHIKVIDPNAATSTGYFANRKRAEEFFEKGNYQAARNEYITGKECSNAKLDEANERLEAIEEIIKLQKDAQDSVNAERYDAAQSLYLKITEYNPKDSMANKMIMRCAEKQNEICATSFNTAERHYAQHRYAKAYPLYKKVLENKCQNAILAQGRIDMIDQKNYQKRILPHVLSYYFDSDASIGLAYGTFNERKVGGFINIRMNNELFDMARDSWEPDYGDAQKTQETLGRLQGLVDWNKAETTSKGTKASSEDELWGDPDYAGGITNLAQFNIAFGFTIPLYAPNSERDYFHIGKTKYVLPKYPSAHLLLGPGYSGYFMLDKVEAETKTNEDTKYTYKTTMAHVISPQIGLVVKYSRLALSFIYEYHFSLKKDYDDYIKKSKFMFGLGIAL